MKINENVKSLKLSLGVKDVTGFPGISAETLELQARKCMNKSNNNIYIYVFEFIFIYLCLYIYVRLCK